MCLELKAQVLDMEAKNGALSRMEAPRCACARAASIAPTVWPVWRGNADATGARCAGEMTYFFRSFMVFRITCTIMALMVKSRPGLPCSTICP